MDQLVPGWLNEVTKQGFLGLIIAIEAVVIWWLDRRCWECQQQSTKNAERLAGVLERCNEVMRDTARSQPEVVASVKELAAVMQAGVRQIEVLDDRSRERTDNLMRSLERGR